MLLIRASSWSRAGSATAFKALANCSASALAKGLVSPCEQHDTSRGRAGATSTLT